MTKAIYTQREQQLGNDIKATIHKGRWLLAAQLATFAAIIFSIASFTFLNEKIVCWTITALAVIAYLSVRQLDGKNSRKADKLKSLLTTVSNELSYLDGDYSCFDEGKEYIDPNHAYSFDLDLFGYQSLFNRINRTITSGGSDKLAHDLKSIPLSSIDEINEERKAVDELATLQDLRLEWIAMGSNGKTDTDNVSQAFEALAKMPLPRSANSICYKYIAILSTVATIATICWSALGSLPSSIPTLLALAQIIASLTICGKSIKEFGKMANNIGSQAKAYRNMMQLIASANYNGKANKQIVDTISSADHNALQALRELDGCIDAFDRRGHALYMLFANALFVNDLWLSRRFAAWKQKYESLTDTWIDAVSTFDARVSKATFRYNEPRAIDADICESVELVYDAKGLYHPFLGDKAVANDFSISDSNYYIITGANMAGKSTFLRALGINYILALCGMPVFAINYKVSLFSIFSSMRTSDDLAHGISYFNAELLRLKQLIATCQHNKHTLIILDEILKGTNSADKLNGSRMFLEAVKEMPITGIIATHDLELSKMADKYPERFHNYCFEISLSANITYSYKIQEGVARNQNATYLLKKILASPTTPLQ